MKIRSNIVILVPCLRVRALVTHQETTQTQKVGFSKKKKIVWRKKVVLSEQESNYFFSGIYYIIRLAGNTDQE